jgi:hypothetical protein
MGEISKPNSQSDLSDMTYGTIFCTSLFPVSFNLQNPVTLRNMLGQFIVF